MRLLLVEDDQMIGESLQQALKKTGVAADWVKDGLSAEAAISIHNYDLVLLDLGLPKKSGIEVLQSCRQRLADTPILILTAQDEIPQRVAGLDAGADDYLVKPFALEELEARIRALLRRKSGNRAITLQIGSYCLDQVAKHLTYQDRAHDLSAKEFALVSALLENPGIILSRSQLEEKLYAWEHEISSNAIEVHIHQLRKKFGRDVIRNVRNLGYSMGKA